MIYLLAQILMALALAGLCGGAIGWLIHRASHASQLEKLRNALGRQRAQLEQSRSDVAMLTDDYDDLHQRSQSEIETLRESNRQIPFLNTNLEKSQLLVRQMMQRHEAKIRDITTENQTLAAQLKTINDREQTHNKVRAELDSVRRSYTTSAESQTSATNFTSANETLGETMGETLGETLGDQSHDILAAHDPLADTSTEGLLADNTDVTNEVTMELDGLENSATSAPSNEADSTRLDINMPLDAAGKNVEETPSPAVEKISNHRNKGSWASAPLASSAPTTPVEDADPFDDVVEVGDALQRELDIEPQQHPLLDGSADRSNLFNPVEQHDDLKQIFGIGPVTEKALNNLGITSYSQLADLQQHEIEKIASALEIVPGRIERDDWVGNARRQLEDVLEQL